jgi:hypothetical protein
MAAAAAAGDDPACFSGGELWDTIKQFAADVRSGIASGEIPWGDIERSIQQVQEVSDALGVTHRQGEIAEMLACETIPTLALANLLAAGQHTDEIDSVWRDQLATLAWTRRANVNVNMRNDTDTTKGRTTLALRSLGTVMDRLRIGLVKASDSRKSSWDSDLPAPVGAESEAYEFKELESLSVKQSYNGETIMKGSTPMSKVVKVSIKAILLWREYRQVVLRDTDPQLRLDSHSYAQWRVAVDEACDKRVVGSGAQGSRKRSMVEPPENRRVLRRGDPQATGPRPARSWTTLVPPGRQPGAGPPSASSSSASADILPPPPRRSLFADATSSSDSMADRMRRGRSAAAAMSTSQQLITRSRSDVVDRPRENLANQEFPAAAAARSTSRQTEWISMVDAVALIEAAANAAAARVMTVHAMREMARSVAQAEMNAMDAAEYEQLLQEERAKALKEREARIAECATKTTVQRESDPSSPHAAAYASGRMPVTPQPFYGMFGNQPSSPLDYAAAIRQLGRSSSDASEGSFGVAVEELGSDMDS